LVPELTYAGSAEQILHLSLPSILSKYIQISDVDGLFGVFESLGGHFAAATLVSPSIFSVTGNESIEKSNRYLTIWRLIFLLKYIFQRDSQIQIYRAFSESKYKYPSFSPIFDFAER
jgi:hypothetical protein